MSTELEWRWADPTGQQRAVRTDELRAALAGGVIAPNTPVWRPGWTDWKPALEVPELASSALAPANGVLPNIPPPPLFMVAVQHAFEEGGPPSPPPAHAGSEPPPPPAYVPAAGRPSPPVRLSKPPPPVSTLSTLVDADIEEVSVVEELPKAEPSSPAPTSRLIQEPTSDKLPPAPAPPTSDKPPLAAGSGTLPSAKGDESRPTSERPPSVPRPTERASSVPRPAPSRPSVGDTSKPAIPRPASSAPALPAEQPLASPIPTPRPSETLVGSSQPSVAGSEANTAVDITALTVDQAERLLAAKDLPATKESAASTSASAKDDPPTLEISKAGRLAVKEPVPSEPGLPKEDPPTLEFAPRLSALGSSEPRPAGSLGDTPKPPVRPGSQTLTLKAPAAPDSADQPALPPPPPLNRPPSMPPAQAQPSVPPQRIPPPPRQGSLPAPPPRAGAASLPPAKPTSLPSMRIPPPPDRPRAGPPLPSPGTQLPPLGAAPQSVTVEEMTDLGVVPAAPDSSADVTAERRPIQEISASILIMDPSGSDNTVLPSVMVGGVQLGEAPRPPPPQEQPDAANGRADATGPRGRPAARLVDDLRALLEKPEHKWTVAALAFGAVLFMVSVTAVVMGLSKGNGNGNAGADRSSPLASSTVSSSAAQPGTATPWVPVDHAAGPAQPKAPLSRTACGMAGAPHVIAPKAVVASGVEAIAANGKLALGFAVGPKDGLAVEVDPLALSVASSAKAHAHEPIRRVVPFLGADRLGAVADVDHKGERLHNPHTVAPGDASFLVGTSDGQLAWAAHASDEPVPLWPLLGDGPVEALRGMPLGDKGFALVFRQDGALWVGALTSSKSPNGLLTKVASLGETVGSPTIATDDDTALVAWADRHEATDPWGVRWFTWKPGTPPEPPQAFVIPPGGLGEQAMSPALAPMSGGRFLLVWTEGPVSSHQVRALTLSSEGAALGSPLTVSTEGVNAGQGQAAITPDGRGVVAFLASTGSGFEIVANPIECPLSAM